MERDRAVATKRRKKSPLLYPSLLNKKPQISSLLSLSLSLSNLNQISRPHCKGKKKTPKKISKKGKKITASMATRSPSPNHSRPSAHNPRTPERSHSIRKSKEIPQRASLSKPTPPPSPRSSFEQKENTKSRSPAVSKVSKNFMVPTISAACKAVPPSPRKRILQERNEVIDSVSASFEFMVNELCSGVETGDIGLKSETGKSQQVLSCGEVKKGDSRIKNRQNGGVPSLSPLSVTPHLHADPSLPPYDPKTNYLSPRPQFLHYRPNPRIENYLNREGEFLEVGDGKRLEDSFSLDSGEDDASVLAEEKDSEEESCATKVEEMEELREGESPGKTLVFEPEFKPEHEESCPVEVEEVEELEEMESPSKTLASEPKFISEPIKCHQPFRRPKMAAFLLVLIMAFLYVPLSDSPIISSFVLKDQSHSNPYTTPSFGVFEDLHLREYFAVANENFHRLGSRFRDWSADSIAYFTYVTSPLKDDIGLQLLVNVTSLTMDGEPVGLDLSYRYETETGEAMQAVADAETEQVVKNNGVEELSFALHEFEVESEQVIQDNGLSEVVKEVDAVYSAGVMELEILDESTEMMEDIKTKQVTLGNGAEHQLEVPEVVKEVDAEHSDIEIDIMEENTEMVIDRDMEAEKVEMAVFEDVKEDDIAAPGIEMLISEDMTVEGHVGYELAKEVVEDERSIELDGFEAVHVEEDVTNTDIEYTQTPHDLEVEPEIIGGEEDGSNVDSCDPKQSAISVDDRSEFSAEKIIPHGHEYIKSMLGHSLAALVVSATLIFLYKKQRQGPVIEKERKTTKGTSAQNLQRDEEAIGDSGSSEVSCSWNNTSTSGQRQARRYKEEQNLSEERRLRRDSASSSSISYGSFTTYERLSARKGGRDDVVTPVRRSSRIRSVVTSP